MKALPDCEKLLMTDVAVCIFFYSVMRDSCGSRQLFGTITTSTLDSSSLDFFKAAAALKKKKKKKWVPGPPRKLECLQHTNGTQIMITVIQFN